MKGPAHIIEHRTDDVRVVLHATGDELKRFPNRERAMRYAYGWNCYERKRGTDHVRT